MYLEVASRAPALTPAALGPLHPNQLSQCILHSTPSQQAMQPHSLFVTGLTRFSQRHTPCTLPLGLGLSDSMPCTTSPPTLPDANSDSALLAPGPLRSILFQGHAALIATAKPDWGRNPSSATCLPGAPGPGVLEQRLHLAHCALLGLRYTPGPRGLSWYPHACQACTECSRDKDL